MNINTCNTGNTSVAEASRSAAEPQVFIPAADIYEKPESVLIRCDLPGVRDEDVEITLHNKVLSVSANQRPQLREGHTAISSEYLTGRYQRTFNLNRDLDDAEIKARLRNGVLEIELPKARESQPRRINITNG